MVIGDMIYGKDLDGKPVEGKIEKSLKSFPIVIVRTGRDNTQVAQCDIKDISVK
jgi:hypothetical protein